MSSIAIIVDDKLANSCVALSGVPQGTVLQPRLLF